MQILILYITLCLSFTGLSKSVILKKFDVNKMALEGSKVEQAKYLLRPVLKFAKIGRQLDSLPSILFQILSGDIVPLKKDRLQYFLEKNGISPVEVGGILNQPLSQTLQGKMANYFVIHDASTPNYRRAKFPLNINDSNWYYNKTAEYPPLVRKDAHVFVNRIGQSITQNNFDIPWRATKFESRILKSKSRGLFLHIELVQPRRSERENPDADELAPEPGFTRSQLRRLALLYILASSRKGEWLVPAFHAVLDEGLKNSHDDPQNFDLSMWCEELNELIQQNSIEE